LIPRFETSLPDYELKPVVVMLWRMPAQKKGESGEAKGLYTYTY
jgi:hypothetical protein